MEDCNADRDAIQRVTLCADKDACGKNESELGENGRVEECTRLIYMVVT
jgi:hypothetical protein